MINDSLNPDNFRRLVRLLSTLEAFQTIPGRQMVLANAGLGQFASSLDFNLSADTFCNQLVRRLESYGALPDTGERALVPLLREARGFIEGRPDDLAYVDGLLKGAAGPGRSAWAVTVEARALPVGFSLAILRGLHARWAALFESLGEADFARIVMHPENGPLSVDDLLTTYAAHGEAHLKQISEALVITGAMG